MEASKRFQPVGSSVPQTHTNQKMVWKSKAMSKCQHSIIEKDTGSNDATQLIPAMCLQNGVL